LPWHPSIEAFATTLGVTSSTLFCTFITFGSVCHSSPTLTFFSLAFSAWSDQISTFGLFNSRLSIKGILIDLHSMKS
jgi:hypothetical protein